MNTADITKVMEIIAPEISPMAFLVAVFAESTPFSNFACTASTTTMASSTTIPIAKIMAKRVSMFMEYPNNCRKKKVPIIATGTAMAGINVDLKS